MKFFKPSKKFIFIWRVRTTLALIFIFFLCGFIFIFSSTFALIMGAISLAFYPVIIILYIPLLYNYCSFFTSDNFITVKKGFFLTRNYTLLVNKIIYYESRQTPLEKHTKTYTVYVYTVGSKIVINNINQYALNDIELLLSVKQNSKS